MTHHIPPRTVIGAYMLSLMLVLLVLVLRGAQAGRRLPSGRLLRKLGKARHNNLRSRLPPQQFHQDRLGDALNVAGRMMHCCTFVKTDSSKYIVRA